MRLFKYLSPERIDVLKNKSIRFSQPVAFNDPFEFKPVISSIASQSDFERFLDENFDRIARDEIPESLRNMLTPQQLKVFFSEFIKSHDGVLEKIFQKAASDASIILSNKSDELVGVLSLTEKRDNLLMWSHYAESHSGYCIGFDAEHSFFNRKRSNNDEFYHLRKVEYLHERPSKSMMDMNGTDMFLLKSDVWEYEQEWRMCSVLADSDTVIDSLSPPVHLFNFPADAIKEVIIGANADVRFRNVILDLTKKGTALEHVKVMQATVSKRMYALEFTSL